MNIGRVAKYTDTGRRRRRNEDAFVVQPPLFAVADGMGGAQAGELASRLAAEALREDGGAGTAEERVVALVQEANRRVYRRSSEDATASGMGTTVTVALVGDDDVVLGHVGDSRAYRIRDGRLEQLTEDHNLVQELLRDGKLSPREAELHPQRSVITRAVGTDPDVDVDVARIEAQPGDLFLLCSDGLTDMVGDSAILEIVEDNRDDLDAAARALVTTANAGGGEDNITVVLFELTAAADDVDETRPLPAAEPAARAPVGEDEDTLSGIDAIPPVEAPPAVDTMVVSPERARELFPVREDLAAKDEGPSLRSRVLATAALLLVVALIVTLVVWGLSR